MSKVGFAQYVVRAELYNNTTIQFKCGDVDWSVKQDKETYTASEDTSPYLVNFGGMEYTIDFKEVDPEVRQYFENQILSQRHEKGYNMRNERMLRIKLYRYTKQGVTVLDKDFADCTVDEISATNFTPFDMKCTALTEYHA